MAFLNLFTGRGKTKTADISRNVVIDYKKTLLKPDTFTIIYGLEYMGRLDSAQKIEFITKDWKEQDLIDRYKMERGTFLNLVWFYCTYEDEYGVMGEYWVIYDKEADRYYTFTEDEIKMIGKHTLKEDNPYGGIGIFAVYLRTDKRDLYANQVSLFDGRVKVTIWNQNEIESMNKSYF